MSNQDIRAQDEINPEPEPQTAIRIILGTSVAKTEPRGYFAVCVFRVSSCR